MKCWYFVFWYKDASDRTGTKSGAIRSPLGFFPIKLVSQQIADENGYQELVITNFIHLSELQYAEFKGQDYMVELNNLASHGDGGG